MQTLLKSRREKISQTDTLKKVVDLATQIQNAGIATVFIDMSGHVNKVDVKLHIPCWYSGSDPKHHLSFSLEQFDADEQRARSNNDRLELLQEILDNGQRIENLDEYVAKQKEEQERSQLQLLKAKYESQE